MPLPPRAAARTAPRSLAPKRWNPTAGAGRCRSSAESSIRCLPAPPPSRCRSWARCTRPTRPSPCRTGPATPPSPSGRLPARRCSRAQPVNTRAFCSRPTANIRQSYRSGGCRRAAWPPNLRAAAPAQCAKIWGWKSPQSPPAGIVMPSGSPCRPARRWSFPPSGWSRAALWACASPA